MAEQSTVKQFLIGALLFTAILTGLFTIIAQSVPTNSGDFGKFNATYSKFGDIKAQTDSLASQTELSKPDSGSEGLLTGMWDATFGTIQQVWESLATMKTIISDLSNGGLPLILPNWFTGLIIAILVAGVTFAIIASVRKWYI